MITMTLWRKQTTKAPPTAADTPLVWTADALHERYLEDIFAYISRRLPVRAEAEDITAETFAAAFTSLRTLQKNTDPFPWLLGIARRKLIDRARKQKRQPAVSSLDIEDGDWTDEGTGADPAAQLIAAERRQAVWSLVDGLKPEQKEALLLQHLEGLSIAEISTVLGKSPAAINSLLQRARATLLTRGATYFLFLEAE
ncbi:RNA polymerase sigma factor [Armatimonas sp.]|uniref:RNA polymerase sigma factor n=1 Tax=Armatimonas sp. TaxID=1872638 RepID=UPI00286C4168|nr:RNA polymerase sigma factor [Armatimonas sp.]